MSKADKHELWRHDVIKSMRNRIITSKLHRNLGLPERRRYIKSLKIMHRVQNKEKKKNI